MNTQGLPLRWNGNNCEITDVGLCYSFWSPKNQIPGESIQEITIPYRNICANIGSVAYGFWEEVSTY